MNSKPAHGRALRLAVRSSLSHTSKCGQDSSPDVFTQIGWHPLVWPFNLQTYSVVSPSVSPSCSQGACECFPKTPSCKAEVPGLWPFPPLPAEKAFKKVNFTWLTLILLSPGWILMTSIFPSLSPDDSDQGTRRFRADKTRHWLSPQTR